NTCAQYVCHRPPTLNYIAKSPFRIINDTYQVWYFGLIFYRIFQVSISDHQRYVLRVVLWTYILQNFLSVHFGSSTIRTKSGTLDLYSTEFIEIVSP
ncbi:hypothetical protein B566_EDAN013984, partial [Ephemera danica]